MIKYIYKILAANGLVGPANAVLDNDKSFLDLASTLSNENGVVIESIMIFKNNKSEYFKIHEEELLQRGIESAEELPPTIVLVDSLMSAKHLVYADYKSHADEVLMQLNTLVDDKLIHSKFYEKLRLHIEEKGDYSTISNYLEGKDTSYLFNCVTDVNYTLVMIDEDSDAYPLTLIPIDESVAVKSLALKAGIKLRRLEKEGLKI